MTLRGRADFRWKNGRKENLKGSEVYLKNTTYIFGDEDSDPVDLDAGFQSFSFSTVLPHEIPSSFECKDGQISYKIEAVLVLPCKINYLKGKTNFKVVTSVDLNMDESLKLPFYTEITKKARNFFFASKTLRMKVCTPFSGFIPGHDVKLIFDINNETKLNVRKMKIQLVQVVKLTTDDSTKTDRLTILEILASGTKKKSNNQFEEFLTIPSNVVPVKFSNVVQVTYVIEIIAKISSSKKKNPKFSIPIEIGTVPINFEDDHKSKRYSNTLNLTQRTSFMSQ